MALRRLLRKCSRNRDRPASARVNVAKYWTSTASPTSPIVGVSFRDAVIGGIPVGISTYRLFPNIIRIFYITGGINWWVVLSSPRSAKVVYFYSTFSSPSTSAPSIVRSTSISKSFCISYLKKTDTDHFSHGSPQLCARSILNSWLRFRAVYRAYVGSAQARLIPPFRWKLLPALFSWVDCDLVVFCALRATTARPTHNSRVKTIISLILVKLRRCFAYTKPWEMRSMSGVCIICAIDLIGGIIYSPPSLFLSPTFSSSSFPILIPYDVPHFIFYKPPPRHFLDKEFSPSGVLRFFKIGHLPL